MLISKGSWEAADIELRSAIAELTALRPGWTSLGTLQLAELRRRQGRLDEASTLFESHAAEPTAWLGRAAIALERDQPLEAVRHARRFLRQVPHGNHTARASAIELIVLGVSATAEESSASHRIQLPTEALLELQQLAEGGESRALRASAALATAASLAAGGHTEQATDAFEEAVCA